MTNPQLLYPGDPNNGWLTLGVHDMWENSTEGDWKWGRRCDPALGGLGSEQEQNAEVGTLATANLGQNRHGGNKAISL